MREKLPNRRQSEAVGFLHRGVLYRALTSRFADGRLAELFLDGGKVGTDAHVAGHDGAIAVSLALQHGVPAGTILKAMEMLADGSPAGPLGKALSLFLADHGKAAA